MNTWTKADSRNARIEGWDIFYIDGDEAKPEIEAVDDLDVLANDDEAIALVEDKAAKGSALHAKALLLERSWDHGQGRNYWEHR